MEAMRARCRYSDAHGDADPADAEYGVSGMRDLSIIATPIRRLAVKPLFAV